MRARFVNEIKQDKEISGLGSIGIGKVAMYPGYNMILKIYNKILKSQNKRIESYIKPLSEFKPITINSLMIGGDSENMNLELSNYEKELISKYTNTDLSELYYIDGNINNKYDERGLELDSYFKSYIEDIWFFELDRQGDLSKLENWELEWCPIIKLGYLSLGDGELRKVILAKDDITF